MCALDGGRSIASTMSFTGLDGLPMGTRTGALDPGVMLYLMNSGMDARAIETLVYKKSGLLGVSGVSNDMRALLASNEPRAALAVDLFVYRIGRELGSLADRPRAGLPAGGLAGRRPGRGRERRRRPPHQHGVQSDVSLGDPDQRGVDDRSPHARPAQNRSMNWPGTTKPVWPTEYM